MNEYITLKTPADWVEAFRRTEAGWMEFDCKWWTPPRLINEIFLGMDAGSVTIETQAGVLAMVCANHAIKNRRSVVLQHLGDSTWESLEPLYLEVMMIYNMPFFRDHLTCGTSMRYPFPDFNTKKPLYFNGEFINAEGEQYSVAVTNDDEYEVLLNGIALYFDQWITAIGPDAVIEMFERLKRRESLEGLLLNGYRDEERAEALAKAGLKTMDDDGYCG